MTGIFWESQISRKEHLTTRPADLVDFPDGQEVALSSALESTDCFSLQRNGREVMPRNISFSNFVSKKRGGRE